MIALSFAAAASSRIALATGVLLLPEHNPVMVAKQAASLDRLSGGRLTLGVGVGWSREEFDALGVPFEHRGARTAEYVDAMRALWRDDVASFSGKFVGSIRLGSTRSQFATVESRSLSGVIATRRCGGRPPGETAGMRSTWTAWRRCVNGSGPWSGFASSQGATAANYGWPWPA